tara:strand:- start:306 stop:488 length:183 start_codon:yes stop_codon:yes gene_type:complete
MKGNNMSKDIETNMNYRELMHRVDRVQAGLSDLIEDADLLRDKFGILKRVIDDSIKPKKG